MSRRTVVALGIASLVLSVAVVGATAQDETRSATVAEVTAGTVVGEVTIDGAVLGPLGAAESLFSDGTDVVTIRIDRSSTEEPPALTLITIVGTATSDGIELSGWQPLPIMVPAVIRLPEEAIEAFQGWMVVQGSQAPVGEGSPSDGEVLTDE